MIWIKDNFQQDETLSCSKQSNLKLYQHSLQSHTHHSLYILVIANLTIKYYYYHLEKNWYLVDVYAVVGICSIAVKVAKHFFTVL